MDRRSVMTLLTVLLLVGVLVGVWRSLGSVSQMEPAGLTRAHMGVLRVDLERLAKSGPLPASLAELPLPANSTLRQDGWGRPIRYGVNPDGGATLASLGADDAPGGTGDNADITLEIAGPTSRPATQP